MLGFCVCFLGPITFSFLSFSLPLVRIYLFLVFCGTVFDGARSSVCRLNVHDM